MREIKFRGKSTKYNGWLFWTIFDNPPIGLIPESIGEFTDLKDKNGKEIFEGDIVKYIKHDGYLINDFIAEIFWKDVQWSIGNANNKMYDIDLAEIDELEDDLLNHLEVIGNIYENPKLLK